MKKCLSSLLTVTIGLVLAQLSWGSVKGFNIKTDGEYVTLSGTVTSVAPRAFRMTADGQKVLVEMDDYDWDADGYKLVKGDKVVVAGRVDNDFLEKKKVEAGSVYVQGLNTYYYANSADEEGAVYLPNTYSYIKNLPDNALVNLQGVVSKVDGREFVVNTGIRKVTVDTASLIYNPMDNTGPTQIDKGDRVRVSGKVDDSFFSGKEVSADFVGEL